jgi:hypothetical protein
MPSARGGISGFRRKTNNLKPEPEGSGRKHHPALLPVRMLGVACCFSILSCLKHIMSIKYLQHKNNLCLLTSDFSKKTSQGLTQLVSKKQYTNWLHLMFRASCGISMIPP